MFRFLLLLPLVAQAQVFTCSYAPTGQGFSLNCGSSSSPPPPPTVAPTAGCPTAAYTEVVGENVVLAGKQVGSVKFQPLRRAGSINISVGADAPAGIRYQVSQCPGDFTPTSNACGGFGLFNSRSVLVSADVTKGEEWCALDPEKPFYYLNIQYANPIRDTVTCRLASCAAKVNFLW